MPRPLPRHPLRTARLVAVGLAIAGAAHAAADLPVLARLPLPPAARGAIPGVDGWPVTPLHALVVLTAGLLLATLPRARVAWAWAAVALAVRLGFPGPAILMGEHYAPRRLAEATGLVDTWRFVDGWSAAQGLAWWLSGGSPSALATTQLVASCGVVLWGTAFAQARGGPVHATGALLATMPTAVALAGTESMFVLCAAMVAAALWGVASPDRRGPAAAACAAILLATLRPGQPPLAAALGIVASARSRRWGAVTLAGVGLAAWPVLRLFADGVPTEASPDQLAHVDPRAWFGPGGSVLALDPTRTPLVVPALALWGLRTPDRARLTLAVLTVVATAPYLHLGRPTDVLRTQLSALVPLALLAAHGAADLWTGGVRVRTALVVAAVASWGVAARPVGPHPAWAVEHAARARLVADVPPGATVWFSPALEVDATFSRWATLALPGRWRPWDQGTPAPGDLVWRSRAEQWPGASTMPCATEALTRVAISGPTGNVEPAIPDHTPVGLDRVLHCPETP